MAAAAGKIFESQADFARRRKVSRKAVTGWKAKGLLVFADDGRIDVEATEWKLDERPAVYRGGVTHRPVRASGNSRQGNASAAPKLKQAAAPRPSDAGSEEQDGDLDDVSDLDLDSPTLSLADAARRKENYLGLQRRQQFEKDGKSLVDRATAVKLFFDTAKANRDAWLNWPARISVGMADELKVDARTLTTVLTAHVNQHLAELGEPYADL